MLCSLKQLNFLGEHSPFSLPNSRSDVCVYRYHIGESMLPSCRQFLKLIDLDETVKNFGFCPKVRFAIPKIVTPYLTIDSREPPSNLSVKRGKHGRFMRLLLKYIGTYLFEARTGKLFIFARTRYMNIVHT